MALSQPARSFSMTAYVLLGLTAILYLAMLGMLSGLGQSDAAGNGMASAFAAIVVVLLWIAVGLFGIACCRGAGLSILPALAAVPLLLLAAVASVVATQLMHRWADWIVIVPLGLPIVAILFGAWVRVGAGVGQSLWPLAVVLALIAALLIGATTARYRKDIILDPAREARARAVAAAIEAQRVQAIAAAKAAVDAKFNALSRESRLDDFIDFVSLDTERGRSALLLAREAETRQADAARLLGEGRIRDLTWLFDLDLEATPTLCMAYPAAVAWHLRERDPEGGATIGALLELEPQLPNMRWLSEGGCDLRRVTGALARRVRHVADTPESEAFAAALDAIHPPDPPDLDKTPPRS